jgi:hypothetical protein
MIKNFEEITYDLSESEIQLALKIGFFLNKKTNENPVLSKDIVKGCNEAWSLKPKLTDVRLRKMINYLRSEAILPIISTSKGYYVSYNVEDIEITAKSLNQRLNSIAQAIIGLQKIAKRIQNEK